MIVLLFLLFAQGEQIFKSSCAGCHGLDGRGGEHAPGIAGTKKSPSEIQQTISNGVPAGGMPAFGQLLTAEQIRSVTNYVLALEAESRSVKEASLDINVSPADLLAAPIGSNWPSYNGDYTGRRFSSLTQITPANVSQLRAQWVFHSHNSNLLQCTPVVVNGVMFVTSGNDATA